MIDICAGGMHTVCVDKNGDVSTALHFYPLFFPYVLIEKFHRSGVDIRMQRRRRSRPRHHKRQRQRVGAGKGETARQSGASVRRRQPHCRAPRVWPSVRLGIFQGNYRSIADEVLDFSTVVHCRCWFCRIPTETWA